MSTAKAEHLIFDAKLKAERDYWVEKLSGERCESGLRLDFERPAGDAAPRAAIAVSVTGPTYENLMRVTGGDDLLTYTFLMAALKLCLQKYNGSDAITVGSPSLSKDAAPAADANALAIADEMDVRVAFRTFLLQVQDTLKAAYARQAYPFARLVKDLGLEPAADRNPLFSVALALTNIHDEMPEVGVDVAIKLDKAPAGVVGEVTYRTDLFRASTVGRFVRHFNAVLSAGLEHVDSTIGDLHILTAPERHELLVEWNDTAVEYAGERCLHRLFEVQAARTPAAIALRTAYEDITYGELNHRANQLARYLQTLGVGPEVTVAVCADRSVATIVGLLAVLKAGGAYLPLDPAYPQERIRLMMADTQAPVLLTPARLADTWPDFAAHQVELDSQWPVIARHSGDDLPGVAVAENAAYVIYTSGSTGKPKGVLVNHWSASCLVEAQIKAFDINAGDRVFQFAPFGFDASVSEVFTTLAAGATLEMGEPEAMYVGPFLSEELKTRGITAVTLPPSIMAETAAENLPALRTIIAAGENCAAATAARWAEGRLFINAYGPTEVAVCASLFKRTAAASEAPPIGRPIENKRIYLLDPLMNPVAIGVKGELLVGGPGLARGYLNRPDVTAERFIPDGFNPLPGARLYRTGDLAACLADGNLTFLGRADHQVKIRGHRIEPGEIEGVLGQSPAVKESVVIARRSPNGDERLIAYVVPAEGAEVSVSDLRDHLKERLPEYMVPAFFVSLSALPLTANGKLDRRNLPDVDSRRPEMADGYTGPRNELEEELAAIFGNVLGLETVGIYDNFFELGGHSLLAVQLITQIRDAFQVELDVIAAFEAPTVAEMSLTIVQAQMEQLDGEGSAEMLNEIEQLSEQKAETEHSEDHGLRA
ncbi:MAG TPA: amino acid adenylation domain-containing protein [Blastocatellia bacterium]|nr:amino acid adenylation domain-containing protein [Blastocatellia bacterium]